MSNRSAQEENIDKSDTVPSRSRTKQTSYLVSLSQSHLPFHTGESILKGELAFKIMEIRVVWIVVWLKGLFDGAD